MAKLNIFRNMKKAIFVALVVTVLSFLISLVPCKKTGGFGVCKLPNPLSNLSDLNQVYYGVSNNPITGLIIQFIIPLVLVMLIFNKPGKKPERVIDYTKKK